MHMLGEWTLTLSLFLYFIFYLPQLWHNRHHRHLKHMSLPFHALFCLAATSDLFYGFGGIVQWQYRLVSLTTLGCALYQHCQLCCAYRDNQKTLRQLHGLLLLLILWSVTASLLLIRGPHKHALLMLMGWVERIAYMAYGLPQWIKQVRTATAKAINPWYLILTLLTTLCDTISAWALGWPLPSLWGAPLASIIYIGLLWQSYRHQKPLTLHSWPSRMT